MISLFHYVLVKGSRFRHDHAWYLPVNMTTLMLKLRRPS